MDAKCKLVEIKDLCRYGCRPTKHESHVATKLLLYLIEHDLIIQSVLECTILLIVVLLGRKGPIEEPLSERTLALYGFVYLCVYPIEYARHRAEDSRLQYVNVLYQLQGVATEVTVGDTSDHRKDEEALLECMAIGEV